LEEISYLSEKGPISKGKGASFLFLDAGGLKQEGGERGLRGSTFKRSFTVGGVLEEIRRSPFLIRKLLERLYNPGKGVGAMRVL